jgi:hypothetical protein
VLEMSLVMKGGAAVPDPFARTHKHQLTYKLI